MLRVSISRRHRRLQIHEYHRLSKFTFQIHPDSRAQGFGLSICPSVLLLIRGQEAQGPDRETHDPFGELLVKRDAARAHAKVCLSLHFSLKDVVFSEFGLWPRGSASRIMTQKLGLPLAYADIRCYHCLSHFVLRNLDSGA